jgi:hypothetical protein
MVGSLLMATTAVLSAKVAVIVSSEVGRSAMHRRNGNCPMGYANFRGEEFYVLFFDLNEVVSAVQVGF